MKKYLLLLTWIMWINAGGQWKSALSYPSKVACENDFDRILRDASASTLGTPWQVMGTRDNYLDMRNINTGQITRIFMVCHPPEFNPR